MLVLQILSATLTISLAKANPVAIDIRNWGNPAADDAFKRVEELSVASPANHYYDSEYIPGPPETSLTRRYYQERATCLDQFVWYCQFPAGACVGAVSAGIVRILFTQFHYCSKKFFRLRLSISGLLYLASSPLFVHR